KVVERELDGGVDLVDVSCGRRGERRGSDRRELPTGEQVRLVVESLDLNRLARRRLHRRCAIEPILKSVEALLCHGDEQNSLTRLVRRVEATVARFGHGYQSKLDAVSDDSVDLSSVDEEPEIRL